METQRSTYLIVGSGVFGASTGLALARKYPDAQITIIDRAVPHRFTASWDWSKVIRADYADILYARLALEAKKIWRENPLYSEFYHETGLIWVDEADDKDFLKNVIANFDALGADEKWRMIPVQELREMHDGVFKNAYFGQKEEVYVNYSSGWVDASKAMQKVLTTAIERGVRFKEGSVSRLLIRESGDCAGVQLDDGEVLLAKQIILAAGAEIPRLLAESAPMKVELHPGDRMSAGGLITAFVRRAAEVAATHRTAPAVLYAGDICKGGIIPPNTENKLKVTSDISTKNTVEVVPGYFTSLPPANPEMVRSKLLEQMRIELIQVLGNMIGNKEWDLNFEEYCFCWDTITPTQDFIISAHPHSENLFIATGGSFHGWKFLPTLGEYVVEVLEGTLPAELCRRWSWDREEGTMVNKRMMDSRELATLYH